jgi:hypothetical protein
MDGFTKVFGSILTSSIWTEPGPTRLVWITMLALKNGRHIVEASVPGLAHLARVSLEECQDAIDKMLKPDPYSRSTEHGGRRIKAVDGGWQILNGQKYQERMKPVLRADYKRSWQAHKPLKGEPEYIRALESGASEEHLNRLLDRQVQE